MSTSKEHIEKMERTRYTYDDIDAAFYEMDSGWTNPDAQLVMPTQATLLETLAKVWRGVQPLLTVLATLPFLPGAWRDALKLFLALIAELVATTSIPTTPDFKAGKDL
jgi:hypothetical protein